MSTKDYKNIAFGILRGFDYLDLTKLQQMQLVRRVSGVLEAEYKNFDPDKFWALFWN